MLRDLKKHYSPQLVPLLVQFVSAKAVGAAPKKTTNEKGMEPNGSDLSDKGSKSTSQ